MSITFLGVFLLPICAACCLSPRLLLWVIILSSPFEGAAALVLGGQGVQLTLIPTIILISLLGVHAALGARFCRVEYVLQLSLPLGLALAYMLVSAVLLPVVFQGQVEIWPQKADPWWPMPLIANGSNLAQCLYSILDFLLMLAVALIVSSWRFNVRHLYKALLTAGLLEAVFCVWQLGSRVGGVPFPNTILYSNPGVSIVAEQSWGNIPRINGTFSEPAALALFTTGILFSTAWLLLHGASTRMNRITFIGGCFTLLLSTSTTGFVAAAIGSVGCGLYVLSSSNQIIRSRFWSAAFPTLLVMAIAALVLSIAVPSLVEAGLRIVHETADKSNSQSYEARTQSDLDSLAVLIPTYGLGVGWGINRSSSLIPGLLAGTGVVGTGLLIWMGVRIAVLVTHIRRTQVLDVGDYRALQGECAFMVGTLVASSLSSPAITSTPFFVALGAVVGLLSRARTALEPHQSVDELGDVCPPRVCGEASDDTQP